MSRRGRLAVTRTEFSTNSVIACSWRRRSICRSTSLRRAVHSLRPAASDAASRSRRNVSRRTSSAATISASSLARGLPCRTSSIASSTSSLIDHLGCARRKHSFHSSGCFSPSYRIYERVSVECAGCCRLSFASNRVAHAPRFGVKLRLPVSIRSKGEEGTMQAECIFCKIATRQIPVEPVYEDEEFIAFHDLNKQAPVHVLLIPKKHYPTVMDVEDIGLLGRAMLAVVETARRLNVAEEG